MASETQSTMPADSSSTRTGWVMPSWGQNAPYPADGPTRLSTGAIVGIAIGCAVVMAVFIGAVWSVGRYKKLRRRESAATLVNDPEADAELRKKDDLAKNPSSTFERLPDYGEDERDADSYASTTKTSRQNSGDTFVDRTLVQPPIPLDTLAKNARGSAPPYTAHPGSLSPRTC